MKFIIYYCHWNEDKKTKPASHDLLKQAVGEYLGREPEPFTVCKEETHGKPYIKELPGIHFSISHAGEYWACAIGDAEVGLDLQDIRPKQAVMSIAKRFFHPDETEWLTAHDADEFFRIWAHKESYIKYTGEGLTGGLDYFSVLDSCSEDPVLLSPEGHPAAYQQEIPFLDGYYMVLTGEESAEIRLILMQAAFK